MYDAAVELFKQQPAVAFQPLMKHGRVLMESALLPNIFAGQLLCLLDPDKAVLDGEQLYNILIRSNRAVPPVATNVYVLYVLYQWHALLLCVQMLLMISSGK
jgi:hypothetical protein